jgi:hypothetical protein
LSEKVQESNEEFPDELKPYRHLVPEWQLYKHLSEEEKMEFIQFLARTTGASQSVQ